VKRKGTARRLDVKLDSTIESLDKAQSLIIQFAEQADYGKQACEQIGLAVRESVANAVLHGNQFNVKKKVLLIAEIRHPGLVISVRDEGKGFDLTSMPDPLDTANLLRESGRGLSLIRGLMDDVKIQCTPGGMELTMTKYRSASSLEFPPQPNSQ
jgi:serine/threonine-protein kinase RsbW